MQICDQIRRTRGLHLCFGHTNRARSHRVLAGESSLDSTYPRKICAREKTISMDERHSADSLTNDESDSMAVDRIRVNLASDGIVSCNSLSEQESPSDYCDRPPSSLSSVATVSPVTLRVSGSASTASGVPVSGVPTVMDHDAAEQQPKTIERRRESLLNDAAEEAKRNAKARRSELLATEILAEVAETRPRKVHKPQAKIARRTGGEPRRTQIANELVWDECETPCGEAAIDGKSNVACKSKDCRSRLLLAFGSCKDLYNERVQKWRNERLDRAKRKPPDASDKIAPDLPFSHAPHMKSVLLSGCTFSGTQGRTVKVCPKTAAYLHGHTDNCRRKAKAWIEDDDEGRTFVATAQRQHRARRTVPESKKDNAKGWLQVMIMLLACQPPDRPDQLVLNMTVGRELFRFYILDRCDERFKVEADGATGEEMLCVSRAEYIQDTLAGRTTFCDCFQRMYGKNYHKAAGNPYVVLGTRSTTHRDNGKGCPVCDGIDERQRQAGLTHRQREQLIKDKEEHWAWVRRQRNNYIGHREEGRAAWAAANDRHRERSDHSISAGADAISCWFTRLPIVGSKVILPWSNSTFIENKVTMLVIHGLMGCIDFTYRIATPAWVHATANLQMTLFLMVFLDIVGLQWEKLTAESKVPPPRKLYWQCDRGSDMSCIAFIGLYAWLVLVGVYDEIIISHLPPDHSHTDYDRMGARMVFHLLRDSGVLAGVGALTYAALERALKAMSNADYAYVDRSFDLTSWLREAMPDLHDTKRWLSWRIRKVDGVVVGSVLADASSTAWPDDQPLFKERTGPRGRPNLAPLWHESDASKRTSKSNSYFAATKKFEASLSLQLGVKGAISEEALQACGYSPSDEGRLQALTEVQAQASRGPQPETISTLPESEPFSVWPPESVTRILRLRSAEHQSSAPPRVVAAASAGSFSVRGRSRGGRGSGISRTDPPSAGDASAALVERAEPGTNRTQPPQGGVPFTPGSHGGYEAASHALTSGERLPLKCATRVLVADDAPPYVWVASIRSTRPNKDAIAAGVRGELFLTGAIASTVCLDVEFLYPDSRTAYTPEDVEQASRRAEVEGKAVALGCSCKWKKGTDDERFQRVCVTQIATTIQLDPVSHRIREADRMTYAVAQRKQMDYFIEELNAD
eukprot:m.273061 g.273061  ORF g.273061 m.273061 type:complete len:1146 (-) comp16114_c0_seq3:48-3485(-)